MMIHDPKFQKQIDNLLVVYYILHLTAWTGLRTWRCVDAGEVFFPVFRVFGDPSPTAATSSDKVELRFFSTAGVVATGIGVAGAVGARR